MAFVIDEKTKVKRGTETLSFNEGKLAKGERVVVVTDAHASGKMIAAEIRVEPK